MPDGLIRAKNYIGQRNICQVSKWEVLEFLSLEAEKRTPTKIMTGLTYHNPIIVDFQPRNDSDR